MSDRGVYSGEPPTTDAVTVPKDRHLLEFFFWTFLLAVPFWLFGGSKLPLPVNLPAGALATFVPMIAAALVVYRHHGFGGVRELLKRAVDFRRIKDSRWYAPALLLMPLIYLLAYVAMRLLGLSLPDQIHISLILVPVYFVMFLIADFGEELGWTGFAIGPMQARWGAFRAALLLGIIWVVWHTIPWVQTGNSAAWILWQALFSIALRILILWVYNNSGRSVFAATLVHVSSNVSWSLFPNDGTHYDPRVTALVAWLAVLAILFVWKPATLRRSRRAHSGGL